MVKHHPAPELLTAFSAGNLPLSHALCVAVHCEGCPQCRTHLQRLDGLGATLLCALQPVAGDNALKHRVMDQLDATPADTSSADSISVNPAMDSSPSRQAPAIPRALRQFIPGDYDALHWQYLSPSIRTTTLCTDINGARVEMLRIKPGGRVATHTHTGDEYTQILAGSFSDESGVYRQGDFVIRDPRHRHKPVATRDRECICLTVTDAPIHFTGWFGRLFNPLVRRRYLPA